MNKCLFVVSTNDLDCDPIEVFAVRSTKGQLVFGTEDFTEFLVYEHDRDGVSWVWYQACNFQRFKRSKTKPIVVEIPTSQPLPGEGEE